MTTLISAPARTSTTVAPRRRPLLPVALLGGVLAAGVTLAGCGALGVIGWFLTDNGTHGTPSDGLRAGALGWLLAHGSGLTVDGVRITLVPLGLTALCAWAAWRIGHHVGDAVSGHGPDADRIADGERDWTVPTATALYAAGYVAVTALTLHLAGAAQQPSAGRAVLWSLLLAGGLGGVAIAVGSGRAAIWAQFLPATVGASVGTALGILRWWAGATLATFAVALALDISAAANVLSQVHADATGSTMYVAASLLLLPNIAIFTGAYLLGPGFAVGTGTVVSPSAVALGPLPLFPPLAALPDNGPVASWTPWLVLVPVLVAGLAAWRAARRVPTPRWDESAIRGCVGGVTAGLAFGFLAWVAGGAVGPGRMAHVTPDVMGTLLHAVVAFGLGGLAGTLLATWRHRRVAAS